MSKKVVIKEGRVVKGGVNKPPQNPRPQSSAAPTKQPQNSSNSSNKGRK